MPSVVAVERPATGGEHVAEQAGDPAPLASRAVRNTHPSQSVDGAGVDGAPDKTARTQPKSPDAFQAAVPQPLPHAAIDPQTDRMDIARPDTGVALPMILPQQGEAVVRQVSGAVQGQAEGRVEIALNPEELGRVHLTLQHGDHGLTVHIGAERPETMDLIRRHVAELAGEFRGMGHTDVAFSFSDRAPQRPTAQTWSKDTAAAPPPPPSALPPLSRSAASGLDIRI